MSDTELTEIFCLRNDVMRVFVVGTGRCGSVTFFKACHYVTNYTAAHESVFCKDNKLDWPDNHISVEPSIWPLLPLLRERYPGMSIVHLIRLDAIEFVPSYRSLRSPVFGDRPTIDVWADCHVGAPIPRASDEEETREKLISLFYAAANAACRAARPAMTFRLEHAKEDWPKFWELIGAEGDYEKALAEWEIRHNARVVPVA